MLCTIWLVRDDEFPSVSVVIPARDDAEGLPGAVHAALEQDYPGPLEVVLAVAPSRDTTMDTAIELAEGDLRVRVVPNPAGTASAGLNRAVADCSGAVVARVDAHCEPGPGYLRRAVEVLAATGADNVGGVQRATGAHGFQAAVARAMSSRFGTGDARFHYGGEAGPVDTVYLGVFRRDALERVGGYDETLLRNQDYELNWRLRAAGGLVWFAPDLEVRYHPRATVRALWRQYHEYGQWKREVLRRHPRSVRWRHLVPPATVAANALAIVLAVPTGGRSLLVPLAYMATVTAVSARLAGLGAEGAQLALSFAVMHTAWGLGLLAGPRRPVSPGPARGRRRPATARRR